MRISVSLVVPNTKEQCLTYNVQYEYILNKSMQNLSISILIKNKISILPKTMSTDP